MYQLTNIEFLAVSTSCDFRSVLGKSRLKVLGNRVLRRIFGHEGGSGGRLEKAA
jgi:hypothetical protein